MAFRIELSRRAEKEITRIRDRKLLLRLSEAIDALGVEPRPAGSVKMSGFADRWRVRVGDWRIVYEIEDGRLVVLILAVAPRGEVYKGM